MKKTKVLITCPDLNIGGGVASYCQTLSNKLTDLIDNFKVGSRCGNQVIVRIIHDYYLFIRRINRKNYHMVHLNPSFGINALIRDGIFLLLAKQKGLRVLVFIHGWDRQCESLVTTKFLKAFSKVYNCADAFIVLAEEFRQKLIQMGINKPIFTESTIINDEIFENSLPTRPNDRFNILYLSRIEKDKGIYETLDSYHQLKIRYPKATLTIAGDGSELDLVKKYVAKMDITDITFSGFIRGDAKHKAFCNADVYLFPTTYGEGMPTTVLEAMAYELPVITRSVGGVKDFFENENMGFITESKQPAVFTEYLEFFLLNPSERLRMGRYNRKYAWGRFSARVVASRIRAIYQNIEHDLHV